MGFNSAFKGLKLFKNPENRRLNNLNDPVLNVLKNLPLNVSAHIYDHLQGAHVQRFMQLLS